MKALVVTASVILALLAASCESPAQPPSLPAYTPTPEDLQRVHTVALNDLEAALDELSKARHTAFGLVEAAPEVALAAVTEAGGCDVSVDDLVSDPTVAKLTQAHG